MGLRETCETYALEWDYANNFKEILVTQSSLSQATKTGKREDLLRSETQRLAGTRKRFKQRREVNKSDSKRSESSDNIELEGKLSER